jgi:hypothetical protein
MQEQFISKGLFMKKVLFSSIVALSLIALTGCNENSNPAPKDTKSAKCSSGKCGGDKKATDAKKCGGDKKATDEKKCGGSK